MRVITYGTFDKFHEGHYNVLKNAKVLGDYLIVGVTSDEFDINRGKLDTKDSLETRIKNIKKTGLVNEIIIENHIGQKIQDILKYKIDIFTVGSDWTGYFDHLNEYCKVIYLPRTPNISSTQIRNKSNIKINKHFTLGTVEMYSNISQQVPYFRTKEFSELIFQNKKLMKYLLKCEDIIFLSGSGTIGMEASVINLFNKNDKLLIINNGNFGQRFVEICHRYQIPYDECKDLDKLPENKYIGLLVNIHETSTGELYNVEILKEYCKQNNTLLVADCISCFLADDINYYDIDVVIVSSQKALSLPPGLCIVGLSNKAINNLKTPMSLYMDFKLYLNNIQRGQTPFTPSIRILYELKEMLHFIIKQNYKEFIRHSEILAFDFREKVVDLGIKLPNYKLSNACTPIYINNANFIVEKLRENGIQVNPSNNEMFRVSHLGNLTLDDNIKLIECLRKLL